MNVAAAAMPALNAALAGISIGVLAAWLDARLKSRCVFTLCQQQQLWSLLET